MTTETNPEITQLLRMLDEAYDHEAWHGPNLRSSLNRLTLQQALFRPTEKHRNLWELILHCAYWKYAVRRKLRGDARGSFALKGSNWFPQPDDLSERDWKLNVDILCQEHVALRTAVAGLNPANLLRQAPNSSYTYTFLVQGAAAHDLYHAGQIQVLKRLQG